MGERQGSMDMEKLAGIANMSGMDPSEQSEMQNYWNMLDKMAGDDPEAYKNFVSGQMKEGGEQMKQEKAQAEQDSNPKVWRIVRSTGELGRKVVLLMREHSKVQHPEWSEDKVPVWVGDPKMGGVLDGEAVVVYDAVFHPSVKAKCGNDKNIQRAVICLALDSVAQTHGTVIALKGWKVVLKKQCPEVLALPFTWEAKQHSGECYDTQPASERGKQEDPIENLLGASPMMAELSSVNKAPSSRPQQAAGPVSMATEMATGTTPAPKQGGFLIEVMSETPSEVVEPRHELTELDGGNWELRVWLPGVDSVRDVEMDISEDSPAVISVDVEGKYELQLTLPESVDGDNLSARFDKAESLLSLTM